MTRSEILDTAKQYVSNDRNNTYGEPEDSFADIAELWNAYWGGERKFQPQDVAMFNLLLKVARLKRNPTHVDSVCDLAGYASCYGEIVSRVPGELA